MLVQCQKKCDVLVAGAGIAGIMAALHAAQDGCSVILMSSGSIFSGSSFYPGTWGLGLIGPTSKEDELDLVHTIEQVGCGMTNHDLVKEFVSCISPSIEYIRNLGIKLRRPANSGQKDFIPCFDHKHRDWNGIEFQSAREVLSAELKRLQITLLPNCTLLDIHHSNHQVSGVTVFHQNELQLYSCNALVLATGGFGGLFQYHLNTEDVTAGGHYLALKLGATLTNMEFMQMMPGYISPCYKTIFNEKTFRYTIMPEAIPQEKHLLEQRSTHGPYTTRLDSRKVDEAIFREFLWDNSGIMLQYQQELQQHQPEFIKTYFDWLKEKKGLTPADPIHIGIFAHASNGGIQIFPDTSTGVNGLFACGEVAGGMHGADRIGGLSTANGLVFGIKAGKSAAKWSKDFSSHLASIDIALCKVNCANEMLSELRNLMFHCAMINRNEQDLERAYNRLLEMQEKCSEGSPTTSHTSTAKTMLLQAQIGTAQAVLLSALTRKESRGSHCRLDYPNIDEHLQHSIEVKLSGNHLKAKYKKEV